MPVRLPSEQHIRPFQAADRAAVIELWRACDLLRPWNDPELDIDRKLSTQAALFLVGLEDGYLCSTAMAGFDGHRGWVNYLAVAPQCRKRGYGQQMMTAVEQALLRLGCPKLNLQVRQGNQAALAFYTKLGYGQDPVISLGKRLIDDRA